MPERTCQFCGLADCRAADGGLCPRWPAAAPMDLVPVDQDEREAEIIAKAIYRGLGGADA